MDSTKIHSYCDVFSPSPPPTHTHTHTHAHTYPQIWTACTWCGRVTSRPGNWCCRLSLRASCGTTRSRIYLTAAFVSTAKTLTRSMRSYSGTTLMPEKSSRCSHVFAASIDHTTRLHSFYIIFIDINQKHRCHERQRHCLKYDRSRRHCC